jgi:hypothetical protein
MAGMSLQQSPARKTRSGPSVIVERKSGEEKEPGKDQDIMIPPGSLAMSGHRERRCWLADVDLESRDMQGIWVGADELTWYAFWASFVSHHKPCMLTLDLCRL